MGDKLPVLRKGLSVEDLVAGTDYARVRSEIHIRALKAALQVYIDEHVDKGERAGRGDFKEFALDLGYAAKRVAESVRKRINAGELTPTILDKLVQ